MVRRVLSPLTGGVGLLTLGLATWAFSVPANDWNIAGPFGGTARSIAVDPQKPDVVLAGGMNSLVFRTTDGGQNWTLLSFPKHNLSEVTSLLVDPADSNHYLAGVISAEDGGLFESRDSGQTWHGVKDMTKFGVRALTVSASKPAEFVAGTLRGVWLSEDSGKTWQHISDKDNLEMQGITAVAVDTANPDIIYAGTTHLPWKTLDRGKTWQSIHTGMIDDSDVFSIFIDPANPSSILASACSGIYASDSRGDAWKKLMGIPNTSRRTHVIRQDPGSANTIYAGTTTGLYKTLTRGAAWKSMTDMQVNSMAFDLSHPGRIYLALEYGGIGKTDNGGDAIQLVNHGYVDRSISAVARSGDKLLALESQEGETSGLFSSADKGESWTRIPSVKGLGGVHLKALTGMPGSSSLLLAASPHQMYKSVDGGSLWKPLPIRLIEPPPAASAAKVQPPVRSRAGHSAARRRVVRARKPIVKTRLISPSEISALYSLKSGSEDLLFAATDLGLLKSTDGGDRWTSAAIPGSPAVTALFLSPDGTGSFVARAASGLFVSKDCGQHWESLPFPLPASDVNEVAISSGDSSSLMAATRVGLYSSTDGGANWYASTAGLPASTVTSVVFTNQPAVAYAVEYGHLYKTADAGKAWKEVPSALPSLRIRRLWLPDLAAGRLYGITGDLGIIFRDPGEIR